MSDECKKNRDLMMGLIDDELTPEEVITVNNHLTRCRSCREEYEELKKSSASLKGLTYMESRDIELDKIWKSPYSRFMKNTGLLMVIAGWVAIILFSLYEMIFSNSKQFLPRISTVLILTGFIVLLFTVIRDRIKTYKSDPYKEVKR